MIEKDSLVIVLYCRTQAYVFLIMILVNICFLVDDTRV